MICDSLYPKETLSVIAVIFWFQLNLTKHKKINEKRFEQHSNLCGNKFLVHIPTSDKKSIRPINGRGHKNCGNIRKMRGNTENAGKWGFCKKYQSITMKENDKSVSPVQEEGGPAL